MQPFLFLISLLFSLSAQAGLTPEMREALENRLTLNLPGDDYAIASDYDAAGNVYVTGITLGTFSGQTSSGDYDCFLAKYNSTGTLQWARQFGSSVLDVCTGIAVDAVATPNVYVTGFTAGALSGQTSLGGTDVFIVRYVSSTGTLNLTRQFGTSANDYAYGAAHDTSNRPTIVGSTRGSFSGFTNAGNLDVFLYQMNTNGTARWTQQFGTTRDEEGLAISVDTSNRFFITGYTGGTLNGTHAGSFDAFVARYSGTGVQSWIRQFGTTGTEIGIGIGAIASSGISNIVGTTDGTFSGQTNYGEDDYFVARYALNGSQTWVTQHGTSASDAALGANSDTSGNVYIAGRTNGSFSGFTNAGGSDAFIARHSSTGALSWRQQIGTSQDDLFSGISASTTGISYPVGATMGVYSGQTDLGEEDAIACRYTNAGVSSWLRQFGTSL
jgi:hypothetical protein